jgi:Fe-S cluster biogenesis protein NfuA/nitrite reductase/ring-hydroxylating ferredoxin subunit
VEDREPLEQVARVEGLLEDLESLPDPHAREMATEVVQALLELYGEGFERIVDVLAEHDADGAMAASVAGDELVSHLLLLHGLHPVPVEQRVLGALEGVRPYLESHGGNVELLGVEEGVVRLRLEGSCSGCPSSAMTLKLAIEKAIHEAAPDVEEVVADGAVDERPAAPALIQLEVIRPGAGPAPESEALSEPSAPAGEWVMAGGLPDLGADRPLVKEVSGEELMFIRRDSGIYAYRPACPGCAGSLGDGVLEKFDLTCASCGLRYDILRAGRCLNSPQLHLEPVPLLVDDAGLVKVAVAVAA